MSATGTAPVVAPVSAGTVAHAQPVAGDDVAVHAISDARVVGPVLTGDARVNNREPAGEAPWRGVSLPTNYEISHAGVFRTDDSSRLAAPVWVAASTFDPSAGEHGLPSSFGCRYFKRGISRKSSTARISKSSRMRQ
jgi:hypothetical protein